MTTLAEDDELFNMIINGKSLSSLPHSRQKRFFMFGPARRILFPPGTAVILTPTLNLPFLRGLPRGFRSQISYSMPFTIDFDGLEITSVLNTFGEIPFLDEKMKMKNKNKEETRRRNKEQIRRRNKYRRRNRYHKRDVYDTIDGINYVGGDREMMFAVAADALSNIGLNGEACLLRAICETHEMPLTNHGLVGEFLQLFLTPSLAPQASKRLQEFVEAEKLGRNCGDCSVYNEACPRSMFTNPGAGLRYSEPSEQKQCLRRHSFAYRSESMAPEDMAFVAGFKSKYKKAKKRPSPVAKFAKEIADKLNVKTMFQRL